MIDSCRRVCVFIFTFWAAGYGREVSTFFLPLSLSPYLRRCGLCAKGEGTASARAGGREHHHYCTTEQDFQAQYGYYPQPSTHALTDPIPPSNQILARSAIPLWCSGAKRPTRGGTVGCARKRPVYFHFQPLQPTTQPTTHNPASSACKCNRQPPPLPTLPSSLPSCPPLPRVFLATHDRRPFLFRSFCHSPGTAPTHAVDWY